MTKTVLLARVSFSTSSLFVFRTKLDYLQGSSIYPIITSYCSTNDCKLNDKTEKDRYDVGNEVVQDGCRLRLDNADWAPSATSDTGLDHEKEPGGCITSDSIVRKIDDFLAV